jgi:hypothetical protein
MTLLITLKNKNICNVSFIKVIGEVILSKVFVGIEAVSINYDHKNILQHRAFLKLKEFKVEFKIEKEKKMVES